MIVDSMTVQEIHDELHNEVNNVSASFLLSKMKAFRTIVLKSNHFPVRHIYEHRALTQNNHFYVQLTALKRSDHKDPYYDYSCAYTHHDGLYCAFLDHDSKRTYVFPPHLFSRYRQRVLKNDTEMSSLELILYFIKRFWGTYITYRSDTIMSSFSSREYFQDDEKLGIIGVIPDGILLGEGIFENNKNICIFKTIITEEMLYDDQREDYEELYVDYCNRMNQMYPPPIAEYIIDLSPNHERILRPSEETQVLNGMQDIEYCFTINFFEEEE